MTMPDNATLQEQPKISLKNLAGKLCITHHILPIFSCTNRFSSFQELIGSFNGTSKEEVEMKKLSKLAKFYEEGIRKHMARWEDATNKNGDYVED
ncbi:hypothetical protein ACTXT7_009786 [Hymenolepis weldensis]